MFAGRLCGSSGCIPRAMTAFLPGYLRYTFTVSRGGLNNAVLGWSRWTFVRASSSGLPMVERKPLVLEASEFQHLFELGSN